MTQPNDLRERLFDRVWSLGVRLRDLGKQLGLSGPVEPLLGYLGPRLMRPPNRETKIVLRTGEALWLPANFPSYRNYTLGLYERSLSTLLPKLIRRGMTVLDVGANVGLHTVLMSRLVGEE